MSTLPEGTKVRVVSHQEQHNVGFVGYAYPSFQIGPATNVTGAREVAPADEQTYLVSATLLPPDAKLDGIVCRRDELELID